VYPSDLWSCKDAEVLLGSGIHSLRSRSKCFELLISIGSSDDLSDEPRELTYRDVFCKSMVVNPEGAVCGVFKEFWIFRRYTLSTATEACSMGFEVKAIGTSEDTTGCIWPSISIITSLP